MYKEITKCRICGNTNLQSVINLGKQSLTGIFPKSKDEEITTGPLELVKCMNGCGLIQLKHSYNHNEMYGKNYGYRSNLNNSMVAHLKDIYNKIFEFVSLNKNDLIIDIGSNDGTFLNFYNQNKYRLAGIDPTAKKFKKFYNKNITRIPDFFSADVIKKHFNNQKAKIIISISMFYDLEYPLNFTKQVYKVLDKEGIWVLEQSYMPLMIERNAYDTICHEHLEYYGLKQIKWIFDKVGFKIIDIELNDTNGGSIKLIVAKTGKECTNIINELLEKEQKFDTIEPFNDFRNAILKRKNDLQKLLSDIKKKNKKVFGYGASTKGNVILQYCNFTAKDIQYIAEVNEDKFGSYTPNTLIPIISEKEAKALHPDYFLVLPWHFKDNFLLRERKYLKNGGKFIFPLPKIEIIG